MAAFNRPSRVRNACERAVPRKVPPCATIRYDPITRAAATMHAAAPPTTPSERADTRERQVSATHLLQNAADIGPMDRSNGIATFDESLVTVPHGIDGRDSSAFESDASHRTHGSVHSLYEGGASEGQWRGWSNGSQRAIEPIGYPWTSEDGAIHTGASPPEVRTAILIGWVEVEVEVLGVPLSSKPAMRNQRSASSERAGERGGERGALGDCQHEPDCEKSLSLVLERTKKFLYSIESVRENMAGDGVMGAGAAAAGGVLLVPVVELAEAAAESPELSREAAAVEPPPGGRIRRRDRVMSCSRSIGSVGGGWVAM